MDIKSLSDSLSGRPAATQASDLLAQLKTAGTIEAEVIKLLPGKLLLSSRLGEILTSNTLNFKPGDRLNLRLDTETQIPVLKASPKSAQPVSLDARKVPDLFRVLPPDRAVLANVIRVLAQTAEIKIAEQILQLPRQVAVVKGQLLSLRRNDNRGSIDITPLERKQIYKAILKQLIPQQSVNRSSALVKLLNLVNTALTEAKPRPAAAESSRLQTANPSPTTILNAKPPGDVRLSKIPSDQITEKPQPAPTAASRNMARSATAAQLLAATGSRSAITAARPGVLQADSMSHPAVRQSTNQINIKTAVSRLLANSVEYRSSGPPKTTRSAAPPGSVKAANLDTIIRFNKPDVDGRMPPTSSAAKPASTTIETPALSVNREALVAPETLLPSTTLPSANAPSQVAADTKIAPTSLQLLLQLVAKLPEIDVANIKHLFAFASLIRTTNANATTTLPFDPVKILQQLTDQEFFSRELNRAMQGNGKKPANSEATGAKPGVQEMPLLQIRDGIKLVEQALSQNLLQRASLGLQQETQQPLSFSIALPFLDEQEVRAFYIDLAQRNQSQEECNKSWDIRISFEFAGLGPISCHIILQGITVAASFYSEQKQTRTRIEGALPLLKKQLIGAGFSPGEFYSFAGKLAHNQAPATTAYSEALVDIEV